MPYKLNSKGKQRRGFAVMPKLLQQDIASYGGEALYEKRGSVWMKKIGKKGGKSSWKNKKICQKH